MVLFATIPGAVVGFLLRRAAADETNALLFSGMGFLLTAMLLLVVSMLGQACFSSRSAEGRPAAENVIVFSQKETVPAAAVHAEKMSAAELTGVQLLRETRGEISPSEGSDRITVLNVRRGRELRHFWQSLSDAFSAAGG